MRAPTAVRSLILITLLRGRKKELTAEDAEVRRGFAVYMALVIVPAILFPSGYTAPRCNRSLGALRRGWGPGLPPDALQGL